MEHKLLDDKYNYYLVKNTPFFCWDKDHEWGTSTYEVIEVDKKNDLYEKAKVSKDKQYFFDTGLLISDEQREQLETDGHPDGAEGYLVEYTDWRYFTRFVYDGYSFELNVLQFKKITRIQYENYNFILKQHKILETKF